MITSEVKFLTRNTAFRIKTRGSCSARASPPLPPYYHEQGSGGGGGRPFGKRRRTATTAPLMPDQPLPAYYREQGSGGGGGPEDEEPVSLYAVDHKINLAARAVLVTVTVRFLKLTAKDWKQETALPEQALGKLNVIAGDGNTLTYDIINPAAAAILVKPGDKSIKSFRIDYRVPFDDFFAEVKRQEKRTAFQYNDIFWCDTTAQTFRVSFNYPEFLRIENIRPIPFDLRGNNELSWELTNYQANSRFKVAINGLIGTK